MLASRPDLDLYRSYYEGPDVRAYSQRSTGGHACQAALIQLVALRHFYDSTIADSGTNLAVTGRIAFAQPASSQTA